MVNINLILACKSKKEYQRIFWVAIGILLVILVLFQGPAEALNLGLLIFSDSTPTKGEKVSTIATIDINSDERIDITRLELFINGNLSRQCKFYINSSIISGCEGINISRLSNNVSYGQGYGYRHNTSEYGYRVGYSNGSIAYNLTFDTNSFIPDNYSVKLRALINGAYFDSIVQNVLINSSYLASLNHSYYSGDNSTLNSGLRIILLMNSSSSGNITIANYSANPIGTIPSGNISFERFYEIDADSAIKDNMSFTRINVSYLDSEISLLQIEESSLRLSYYNISSGIWEVYDGVYGGVDTVNNVVWAITTHFSIFGIFGTTVTTSGGSSGGSGGGSSGGGGSSCTYSSNYNWNCSDWSICTNGKQTRTCNLKNNCGTSQGRPSTEKVCSASSQLFDIKLELEDSTIETSNKLSSIIKFENFGNVPTKVDLTYKILNRNGDEVYLDKGEITVTTQETLRKNFENLNLAGGKYNLVLTTVYGANVTDEFRQEFTVGKQEFLQTVRDNWILPVFIAGIVIAIIIVFLMFYFAYKKRNEDEEKSLNEKIAQDAKNNPSNQDYASDSNINSVMGFNGV